MEIQAKCVVCGEVVSLYRCEEHVQEHNPNTSDMDLNELEAFYEAPVGEYELAG